MSQMSPPIEPDALPVEPPSWPKVVGIISIVWGGLGLVCGGCGTLFGVFGRSMIPAEKSAEFPPYFVSPQIVILACVGLVFSVFLMFGGAMTVARKPAGRIIHLVWAILTILSLPIGVYFNLQQQAFMEDWVRQNPSSEFAKQQLQMGGGQIGKIVGWAAQAVFGLGYPLFCLIWFGLVKRRTESMGVIADQEVV